MITPYILFRDGGPFMYLEVLVVALLPVVVLGVLIARAFKLRVPFAVPLVGSALPLTIGLVGTYVGLDLALSAVVHASPEIAHKLAANGLAVGLYTAIAGATLSSLVSAVMALAVGLGTAIGAGANARLTPLHVVVPAFLGVLTLGGVVLGAWLGGLVAAATAVGLVLASLRFATEPESDAERAASGRAQVGVLGLFALVCAFVTAGLQTLASLQMVQAAASAALKGSLVASALQEVIFQGGALVGLTVLITLAAAASAGPVARHLGTLRTLVSAAAALVLLLPLAGSAVLVGLRVQELQPLTEDPAIARLAAVEDAGLELPRAADVDLDPAGFGVPLRVGERIELDGAPTSPERFICPEDVVIESDGRAPLAAIAPYAKRCVQVRWAVLQDGELRALEVLPADRGSDDAIELIPVEDRVVLVQRDAGVRRVLREVSRADIHTELDEFRFQSSMEVWFPPGASSQDLVDHFVAAKAFGWTLRWRVDPVPALPEAAPVDPDAAGDPVGAADPQILGTLDRSELQQVVRRYQNQVRYCYERELVKNADLQGKLTVKFVVGADGGVASASVQESTLENTSVETCIVGRFMRMQFPKPKGGGIVVVSYPFVFAPG